MSAPARRVRVRVRAPERVSLPGVERVPELRAPRPVSLLVAALPEVSWREVSWREERAQASERGEERVPPVASLPGASRVRGAGRPR